MKKYCRYCSFCFEGDGYFGCSNHPKGKEPYFSRKQINTATKCKNFVLSDLGDVETGEPYRPRNHYRKRQQTEPMDQLTLDVLAFNAPEIEGHGPYKVVTTDGEVVTIDATPSEHKGIYWDKYHTNNLDEIIEKYKEEQRNPPRTADGYVIRDGFLETIISMRERR